MGGFEVKVVIRSSYILKNSLRLIGSIQFLLILGLKAYLVSGVNELS